MEHQVGLVHHAQRASEGRHQVVGELADEAHRVGKRALRSFVSHPELAGGGVQGGEQSVLGEHLGPRQRVEEGGLSRVGVAGQRHRERVAAPALALLRAAGLQVRQFPSQLGETGAGDPAVRLQLRFARAQGSDAATLALQVGPHLGEPGDEVLELGDLHLQLGLAGARLAGEDVQDQAGAVQDEPLRQFLQALGLSGRQVVVEHDLVDVVRFAEFGQLAHLPLAQEGGGIEGRAVLHQHPRDLGARGEGEPLQLGEMLGGGGRVLRPCAHAHQDHALPGIVVAPARGRGGREIHSHSMVPGGLWVQS